MLKSTPYRIEANGNRTFRVTCENYKDYNYHGHSYSLERFLAKCRRRGCLILRTGYGAMAIISIPPHVGDGGQALWAAGAYTFQQ